MCTIVKARHMTSRDATRSSGICLVTRCVHTRLLVSVPPRSHTLGCVPPSHSVTGDESERRGRRPRA
ncbi:hypothetical protein JOB18_024507 [Solea senegalensis]|uniref:Uncharacterized protein n=1 Tax=Solea senegalensis TaxID=28829 RepID=A0AAV6QK91_SOLSE|nr:hypothetical protein JOB18_024507 [Solea senegalensis]